MRSKGIGFLIGGALVLLSNHLAMAGGDEIPDTPPLQVLMQIQSGMEHSAAGLPQDRDNKGSDPLFSLVDAYRAYLRGDVATLDKALHRANRALTLRLDQAKQENRRSYLTPAGNPWRSEIDDYIAYVAKMRAAPGEGTPLQRLVVQMRATGAFLFMQDLDWLKGDVDTRNVRQDALLAPAQEYAWLRLPCRTLIGRVPEFVDVHTNLGELAGPLLSCPSDRDDLTQLEKLAQNPSAFSVKLPEQEEEIVEEPEQKDTVPPLPWNAGQAASFMASNPDEAERALAEAASDDREAALNLAVFLKAFRPASVERDARIRMLTDGLLALEPEDYFEYAPKPNSFDGSDDSLNEILVYLSVQRIVGSGSVFYSVPCDALLRDPALLAAIGSRFGATPDNFTPRSGCEWGVGKLSGFPVDAISALQDLMDDATGNFIGWSGGTIRYGYMSQVSAAAVRLQVFDPEYLNYPLPEFDFPYQVWGMTGLSNHVQAEKIRQTYDAVLPAIVASYQARGISQADAFHAAKYGLFDLHFGTECGRALPQESLRAQIMAGAPLETFRTRLQQGEDGEAREVKACGRTAGLEPLEHVAVLHAEALAFLLDHGGKVDQPNSFGKTPLMSAAQYDRLEAARLLLAKGAQVNAATWRPGIYDALRHDGRTVLMYAASRGSLPMIELLLKNGADPYAADSKGRRAVDYLLGYGPDIGPNPILTDAEREKAIRVLY